MASRDYQNDYPSVTQILGVLRKIGLEMWFKWNTAAFCDEKTKKGAEIGTQIHKGIEEYINTGALKIETEYTEEVTNAIKSFALFRKENPQYTLKNSEKQLLSQLHKCNGTLDCEATEGNEDIIFDWKTGECKKKDKPSLYNEMKYQVSAYVMFNDEMTGKTTNKAAILILAKDKIAYNLYLMDRQEIENHFNEAFLPALKIYNHEHKKEAK